MKPLALRQLAHAIEGRLIGIDAARAATMLVDAIGTDSRQPPRGGVFVALKGPRFDAHDFVADAFGAGARAAIVDARHLAPDDTPIGPLANVTAGPETCLIAVADPQRALEDLGRALRSRHPGRFVAVTGSVGKTTIKNMLADALRVFGPVASTPGNLNNRIGLPLTLASTRGDEAHVVLELGMSAPGEIAHLTGIARPEIGIVCAAAAAHLEFFESVDGIADAKCEMFEHLPAGATAVANADDERIFARAKRLVTGRLVTWGRHPEATVRIVAADPVTGADGKGLALSVRILCDHESVDFQLPAIGAHNAHNAAAALAACHAFGLPLAPAAASLVKHFRPAPHRLEVVAVTPQLTVIDDAYNANPSSMAAALETLGVLAAQGTTRPRLALVLGTMHELGPDAADLHRDIGRQAAGLDPELVIATGPLGAHYLEGLGTTRATTMHVADVAAAAPLLETFATPNDRTALMLLKGSRAERLERVIDGLRRGPPHPEGGA